MKECKHPTCGDDCRRAKKEKSAYKIRTVAVKRSRELREYSKLKAIFLVSHDECEIQSPEPGVCTSDALPLVIHHPWGRENKRLLDVRYWMASCPGCNIWIETSAGTKWAYDNKKKFYKHQLNHDDECITIKDD